MVIWIAVGVSVGIIVGACYAYFMFRNWCHKHGYCEKCAYEKIDAMNREATP